jgi:hypothetical protein
VTAYIYFENTNLPAAQLTRISIPPNFADVASAAFLQSTYS